MNTRFSDKIWRAIFIFLFVLGTAGTPNTRAKAVQPDPDLPIHLSEVELSAYETSSAAIDTAAYHYSSQIRIPPEKPAFLNTGSNHRTTSRFSPPTPQDAQSTTGPMPPKDALSMRSESYEAGANAHIISGVPNYLWRHGCGPTAAGMVLGYWDAQGNDWLIPGSAATQTAAVDQVIASETGVQSHYHDYVLPLDNASTGLLADLSELPVGDEHTSNSIADFMHTSFSYDGNYYGWSWFSDVRSAFLGYVDLVDPGGHVGSASNYYFGDGSFNWELFTNEIDAERPMLLLVDSNGDGSTDHFIPAFGYDDSTGIQKYAAYNTWDEELHWYDFGTITPGFPWGIYGGVSFSIEPYSGPVTPSDLIVSDTSSNSVTISWQDNSDNEDGFKIYRWEYDGSQWTFMYLDTVGPNVTSYTQSGLACGSNFNYYEVSAFNSYAESPHIGWVQGVTEDCSPFVEASARDNWVNARGWPLDTEVTLTINGAAGFYSTTATMQPTPWNPNDPNDIVAPFDLQGYDIQVGDQLTATVGPLSKDLTVSQLQTTGFDVSNETISGKATPNVEIQVCANAPGGCISRVATADGAGNWTVDYSPELDLGPGSTGWATERDAEGDQTWYDWNAPDQHMDVWYADDNINAYDWPFDTDLTLEIEDPTTSASPDYTTETTVDRYTDWDLHQTLGAFHLRGIFDVRPGMTVTISGSGTTHQLLVSDLVIDDIDQDTDIITGTTEPNQMLWMWTNAANCCRGFQADENGVWTVDYSQPGPYGEPVQDIGPGSSGTINANDADRDNTSVNWYIFNPGIGVRANDNRVEGWDWTFGTTVTVTVDDPLTVASPDVTRTTTGYENLPMYPGELRFDISLNGIYDIKIGDIVTATDGTRVKTTTVTSLAFTDMNRDTDVVTGIASAGATVDIWACDNINCYNYDPDPVADANGIWSVDFTHVHDLTNGTWVDSLERDPDGDSTMFGKNFPNPRFDVRANEDRVEVYEWALGTTVTLEINDPANGSGMDYTDTRPIILMPWDHNQTYAEFNLGEVLDIKPGFEIRLSDGSTTKTHTVTSLAFANVDIDSDIVTGVGQANSWFDIWTCDYMNCYNYDPDPFVNWLGEWSVDFTSLHNIVDGTWIDSSQTDSDGDATMFGLNVSLPSIEVSPSNHLVNARGGWPDDTLITMAIDDPNTPGPVDYSADATFGQNPNNLGDPNDRLADFDMGSFTLQANQTITMIGGGITKTYTIQPLAVTNFDVEADTISGTGIAEHQLLVCVNGMPGNCNRHVAVDSNGNWLADYQNPGTRSDEQDTTDIHLGSDGWVADYEEDGDQTWLDWTATLGYVTVTSIDTLDANPTSAASVRFSVSFSQPVTNVDASDFNLTTTGITGASITNVSGSDAEYTVTVNTGNGTGTLRLNLIDNDSIVDGSGVPLAGPYSYNGSYTTGQGYVIMPSGGILPRNETLYFNGQQWDAVACWNPYSSTCNNSMTIAQQDNARVTVWETPYIYNMITGEQLPLLADGPYTWNGARTEVIFTIKAAAKWSDGTPVTAYDVAYTWATNIKYGTDAGLNFQDYIDTIEAVNAHTVRVRAKLDEHGKAINPLMVSSYLSTNYVIQKAWTQLLEDRSGYVADLFLTDPAQDFVASGPYAKLLSDDTQVVLMRDDNYWGKDVSMWGRLPAPKYLAHMIYADNDAGLDAFKAGEVDVSQQFIPNVQDLWLVDGLPVSTYLPDAPYGIGASLPTAFYNLNSYGLDNVAVRKAIAIAVDYDAIIANAMTNQSATFTQVPRSLMNPSAFEQSLYDHTSVADLQWAGSNIVEARALLDAAGIIDTDDDGWREYNGQKLSYVATCPYGWTDWEAAIEIIAASGRAIGIDITTSYPEWVNEYQDAVTNWPLPATGYDIFMMWSDGAGPTEPWGRIRKLMSSEFAETTGNWNGNWGGYINPAADALIQAIPAETDPVQLKADYTELTRIYLTDIPSFTVMYRPQNFHSVNESVWTNFPREGDGTNPPIPPLSLTDGYSIAGLYDLTNTHPTLRLIGPSGILGGWNNTFRWSGLADAEYYRLEVYDAADTMIMGRWFTNGICTGIDCAVSPVETLGLSRGDFKWRVQSYGVGGYGPWTEFMSFTINAVDLHLTSPAGSLDNWTNSFRWSGISSAEYYHLEVRQVGSEILVLDQWYPLSVCTGLSCAASPVETLNLANGEYKWRLQTYSSAGYTPWSEYVTFDLGAPIVVLNAPSGTLASWEWDKTFRWTGIPSAEYYHTQVYDATTDTLLQEEWYNLSICNGMACAVSPSETRLLGNGQYKWRVQSYGTLGYTPWTAFSSFTISSPTIDLTAPGGTLTAWDKALRWTGIASAEYYHTQVYDAADNLIQEEWYNLSICNGLNCVVLPNEIRHLPNGSYKWRVQSYGSEGYTAWTEYVTFTLNYPTIVLNSPIGTLTSWENRFEWTGLSTAAYYHLQVYDATTNTLMQEEWYTLSICEGLACVVSPLDTLNLPDGEYKWRVQSFGTEGYTSWTDFGTFQLMR